MNSKSWTLLPATLALAALMTAGCSHGSSESPASVQASGAQASQTAVSKINSDPSLTDAQKASQSAAAQKAMNLPPRMLQGQTQ